MKITPINQPGSHRTGGLSNITVEEIEKVLGFEDNIDDDPDKVAYSWGFTVADDSGTSIPLGIWDYKGSHEFGSFSTFGGKEIFEKLFPGKVDKI